MHKVVDFRFFFRHRLFSQFSIAFVAIAFLSLSSFSAAERKTFI